MGAPQSAISAQATAAHPAEDGDARARLMLACVKLCAAKGLDGTTTREIAQEAGLNVSLISYYFGGKEGLYRAVLHEYASQVGRQVNEFQQMVSSIELTRESFKLSMRELMNSVVQGHQKWPDTKAMLFREFSSGLPFSRELFDGEFFKMMHVLTAFVERAQSSGVVRKDVKPLVFMMMLVNAIDSFVMMARNDSLCSRACFILPEQSDEMIEQVLAVMLEGGLQK